MLYEMVKYIEFDFRVERRNCKSFVGMIIFVVFKKTLWLYIDI